MAKIIRGNRSSWLGWWNYWKLWNIIIVHRPIRGGIAEPWENWGRQQYFVSKWKHLKPVIKHNKKWRICRWGYVMLFQDADCIRFDQGRGGGKYKRSQGWEISNEVSVRSRR